MRESRDPRPWNALSLSPSLTLSHTPHAVGACMVIVSINPNYNYLFKHQYGLLPGDIMRIKEIYNKMINLLNNICQKLEWYLFQDEKK